MLIIPRSLYLMGDGMVVEVRVATERDLDRIVTLINEFRRDAYEFYPYDSGTLLSRITEGKFIILVAEQKKKILGSVAYHDSYWGEEIEWLAVFDNQNKRAIEDELVTRIEKYAKSGKIFTPVDAGSPRIEDWISRGYHQEGGLCHMIAVVDNLKPVPEIPQSIILRCLKPSEENAFVEAVNAGFGSERVRSGDIEKWKTESPPFDENWIQIAESDGKIISIVVARPDSDYNKLLNANRGYLGPAATLPEYRNQSLASALTVRAMNFLYERGMSSVALYTSERNVASVTLLQKIGFNVGHDWKFMRKILS